MSGLSQPHTKAGRLQRACLDLLKQHESDGALPTNGRFQAFQALMLDHLVLVLKCPVADLPPAFTAPKPLPLKIGIDADLALLFDGTDRAEL